MAAAAAGADAELVASRLAVAKACDSLITRSTLFNVFNESLGARDYARWRRDLFTFVTPAGPDFVAALSYTGSIAGSANYDDALVVADTAAARPAVTMPVMRQQALLAVIRATIAPDGASAKLIRTCVHAGGIVQRGGANHDQALVLLDKRWGHSADTPETDVGEEAKKLHSMTWPSELTVDAFSTYFNLAVSRASLINVNPLNDDNASIALRSTW